MADEVNNIADLTLRDCLTSKQFWLIEIMMFLSVFYGYFIVNSYKVFGKTYIESETFINTIGAISSACASI